MTGFLVDDATPEEIESERSTYGPIAEVLRELAEASIRTTVAPEVAARALAQLSEVRDLLTAELGGASYGLKFSRQGFGRPWGNAVVGVRNPVAPPLDIVHEEDRVWAQFTLGPQYEGPPTFVHGGVASLILDQMLGEAAAARKRPGMTGTLTVRYRRPTPLGPLTGEARIERIDGIKTFAVGHIADAEGVCVEAEGVFILPKWARGEGQGQPRFE